MVSEKPGLATLISVTFVTVDGRVYILLKILFPAHKCKDDETRHQHRCLETPYPEPFPWSPGDWRKQDSGVVYVVILCFSALIL